MKDKEMIEEILDIICQNRKTKFVENCDKCHTKKYCATVEKAKSLYNAGYRKLPENARVFIPDGQMVLLSREELEEKYVYIDTFIQVKEELEFVKRQKDKLETRIAVKENDIGKLESEIDDLKEEHKQASKETAEKWYNKVKELYLENVGEQVFEHNWFGVQINKFAKQFGVEIKE